MKTCIPPRSGKKWKNLKLEKKIGFGKEKSVSDTEIGPWFWFQIPKLKSGLTWFWFNTNCNMSNWLPLIYICRHMQKSERVTNAWRSKKKELKIWWKLQPNNTFQQKNASCLLATQMVQNEIAFGEAFHQRRK